MSYFDCYLVPVPTAKLDAYKLFSQRMAKVYREYGALRVIDCILDPETTDGTQFHAEGAQADVQGAELRDFNAAAATQRGRNRYFVLDRVAEQRRSRRPAAARAGRSACSAGGWRKGGLRGRSLGRRRVRQAARYLTLSWRGHELQVTLSPEKDVLSEADLIIAD
ncbi:DUF1428 family protein [Sinorhizobium medicae]|uniref:DUF1428 family protein n=1 Tax=Sinorhizobium medicae TaxID=110321 RepID=UPI0013903FBC|nr:DUF1428 family protein [Sinorhizobium medicae]MBO1944716.1 DUF1428 family protein [Sinorhizobium medicae]